MMNVLRRHRHHHFPREGGCSGGVPPGAALQPCTHSFARARRKSGMVPDQASGARCPRADCPCGGPSTRGWEHHWVISSSSQPIGADHGGAQGAVRTTSSSSGCAICLVGFAALCSSTGEPFVANHLLRVLRPALVRQFAESHDAGLWRCLCQLLDIPEGQCEATARIASIMQLVLGGIGLRSAARTSLPAYSASWCDCLHMVHQRHPDIAAALVDRLEAGGDTPNLSAAVAVAAAMRRPQGVEGFEPPSWTAIALGARTPRHEEAARSVISSGTPVQGTQCSPSPDGLGRGRS